MGTYRTTNLTTNRERLENKIPEASKKVYLTDEQEVDFLDYVKKNQVWNIRSNCAAWTAGAYKASGQGSLEFETLFGMAAPWIIRDKGLGNGAGGGHPLSAWDRPYHFLKESVWEQFWLGVGHAVTAPNRHMYSRPTNLR